MVLDSEEKRIIYACHPKNTPVDNDSLWQYMDKVLNIRIPRTKVCPGCDAPFDIIADAYFARYPAIIMKGARGAGKSMSLAALALTEQLTLKDFTTIVAASEEQSQRIMRIIRAEDPSAANKFYDSPNFPKALVDKELETKLNSNLTGAGRILALSSSTRSLRGVHPSRLRIDELDVCLWEAFTDSLGQPRAALHIDPVTKKEIPGSIRVPIQVLVSSTHHLASGSMTKLYQEFPDWPRRSFCYRETMISNQGWVTQEMVDQWRAMTTNENWICEYENGEPSIESRIWHPNIIEEIFDRTIGQIPDGLGDKTSGVFEGGPNTVVKIEEPDPFAQYYTGVDWAKSVDWTVISTFRRNEDGGPDVLVHWARLGRQPWQQMIDHFNRVVDAYPGPSVYDATGCGNVIADYLNHPSKPVNFSSRKLIKDILTDFQIAVEQKRVRFPYIKWLKNQFEYASHGQLYGTEHLPDGICSAALAWYARQYGLQDINIFRI